MLAAFLIFCSLFRFYTSHDAAAAELTAASGSDAFSMHSAFTLPEVVRWGRYLKLFKHELPARARVYHEGPDKKVGQIWKNCRGRLRFSFLLSLLTSILSISVVPAIPAWSTLHYSRTAPVRMSMSVGPEFTTLRASPWKLRSEGKGRAKRW